MRVESRNLDELKPYKNNAKRHSEEQVKNVAASIKAFGFIQPIVVDRNDVIVVGHSRALAAKKLGMKEVPVVTVDSLTDEEVSALRIADNKLNESAWDKDLLMTELEYIKWDVYDLDFDFSGNTRRQKAWEHIEKKCNLKKSIRQTDNGQYIYTTFYNTSKDGIPLEEIKSDRSNVELFADCLVWYVKKTFGFLGSSWCLMTTPRRRNKDFHFATAICEVAAEELGIPFYIDAVQSANKRRIEPEFIKNADPAEDNIILYDDIITTGKTIQCTRDLYIDYHAVIPVIAIRNKGMAN